MPINDLLGVIGYAALSAALFVCALLVLLSGMCHFRPSDVLRRWLRLLVHTQSALMAAAVLALLALLERSAFEYELVFETVESSMPWFYRLAGIWSGQAGSLLFWSFVMALAVSLAAEIALRMEAGRLFSLVIFILEFTLFFFLMPDVFVSNPFEKIWLLPNGAIAPAFFPPAEARLVVSVDGQGMNPSLRHPAMLSHPPTLYLGLVGLFIPYAFALAGLVYRLQPVVWIRRVYRVCLAAWVFLTIGMLLGSWWAYTILGWGGYWGWDAVEISGLLPWLLSTALVHSMYMANRGRAFQRWVVALAFSTAILILFGILITRSGILESVHAYASSAMGPVLTVLVCAHLLPAAFLLTSRWRELGEEKPQAKHDLGGILMILSNILLAGAALVYLVGQTFPLTSGVLSSEKLSFSPAQYEGLSSPFWLLFALAMALYPFANLTKRDGKSFFRSVVSLAAAAGLLVAGLSLFIRLDLLSAFSFWVCAAMLFAWLYELCIRFIKPLFARRVSFSLLGSIFIHLGFALLAFGIIGVERLASYHDVRVAPGESASVEDFSIQALQPANSVLSDGRVVFAFPVQLSTNRGAQAALMPLIEHFPKLEAFHAQPDIYSTPARDIQLVAESLPAASSEPFSLRVNVYPFMTWLWAGGALMILGGFLSLLKKGTAPSE